MEFLELAITLLLVLCILLGSGVWVGLAMIGVGVVAMTFFTGRPVGSSMFSSMWMSSTSWSLTALPL
ncbi:MAG: C4-dicarboxylate ABC transporter permease, partial [Oceanospirillales bacterium]|nr:C4-dicarboxylate ABC transporter permease [Oceanospirillales bacterium]